VFFRVTFGVPSPSGPFSCPGVLRLELSNVSAMSLGPIRHDAGAGKQEERGKPGKPVFQAFGDALDKYVT